MDIFPHVLVENQSLLFATLIANLYVLKDPQSITQKKKLIKHALNLLPNHFLDFFLGKISPITKFIV